VLASLLEDFPDQPHMTERVHYSTLEHPPDRVGSNRLVLVFYYRISFHSSGGQSFEHTYIELSSNRAETRSFQTYRYGTASTEMSTVTGLFPCLFEKPESILRLLVCPR